VAVLPGQDPTKPVTGDVFVDRLFGAVRDADAGIDAEANAERAVGGLYVLEEMAMRPDEVGIESRKIRDDLMGYFDWRNRGRQGSPRAPFQGVMKRRGLWPFEGEHKFVDGVTKQPAFFGIGGAPDDKYLVSPEFSQYVIEDGRIESSRRAALLGYGYQSLGGQRAEPVRDPDDGSFWVQTSQDGWERLPVDEVVKDWPALRAAFQGVIPAGGGVIGDISGRMPLLGAVGEFAARGIASQMLDMPMSDVPPLTNVRTADPAMRLPALPNTGDHFGMYAKLNDPRYVRAIQEVMGMVQSGTAPEMLGADLRAPEDSTFWESTAGALGFVADFWAGGAAAKVPLLAASKGLSAVRNVISNPIVKLVGKGGASAADVIAGGDKLQSVARFAQSRKFFPMVAGAKTVGQFAAYESLRAGLYGDMDMGHAAMHGAKQGVLLWAAHTGISVARGAAMRHIGKAVTTAEGKAYRYGGLGRWMENFTNKPRAFDDMDTVMDVVSKSSGSMGLRRQLADLGMSGMQAEYAVGTLDSMLLGALMGAHGDAMSDPEYENLTGWGKTARVMQGLASPEALGTAVGFGATSQARAVSQRFQWGREWEGAPAASRVLLERKMRDAAALLANPDAAEVDRFRIAFEALSEQERIGPDGKRLTFITPEEREALIDALREVELEEGDIIGPLQSPPEPPPEERAGPGPGAPPSEPGAGGPTAAPSTAATPERTAESVLADVGKALQGELSKVREEAGGEPAERPPPEQLEPSAREAAEIAEAFSPTPAGLMAMERSITEERVEVDQLRFEPEKFQYKSGGTSTTGEIKSGPLSKLRTKEEFSDVSGKGILVYKYASGELAVVDGHQRTNAAKRLGVETLSAHVLRERDGVTPELARSLGALLNIRDDKGSPIDAARVIRDLGWGRKELRALGVPPTSAFMRKAAGLAELSDAVFSMALNEEIPEGYAAAIGKHIPRTEQDKQLAAAKLIKRSAESETEADDIARQVSLEDAVSFTQESLFGESGDTLTMVELRAKLREPLRKALKQDKAFFGKLSELRSKAEEAGSTKVDVAATRERASSAEEMLEAVIRLGDMRGTIINQVLNDAARRIGPPYSEKPADLAKGVIQRLKEVDPKSLLDPDAREAPPPEHGGQDVLFQSGRKPDPNQLTAGVQVPGFAPNATPGRLGPTQPVQGQQQLAAFPPGQTVRGRSRQEMRRLLQQHFEMTPESVGATIALMDSVAQQWAEREGRPAHEWYPAHIADVRKVNSDQLQTRAALTQTEKGAVEFLRGGQAVIYALKDADISTALHEMGHVWRRTALPRGGIPELNEWAGVKKGVWTRDAEEKFASAVERYMRDGVAPVKRLEGVFGRIREYMVRVYASIKGSPLEIEIPDFVRDALDRMFMGKGEIKEKEVISKFAEMKANGEVSAVYEARRNDAELVGMDPDEMVYHILRNDLVKKEPTHGTRMAQAGDSYKNVVEILRAKDLVEVRGAIVSSETARTVSALANGGSPEIQKAFADAGDLAGYGRAVELAKRARVQMREALGPLLEEVSGKEMRDKFDDFTAYVDANRAGTPPADLKTSLQKRGLVDKDGNALPGAMGSFESLAHSLRETPAMKSTMTPNEGTVVHVASPWVAFDRGPTTMRESWLSRNLKAKVAMDRFGRRIPPSILKQLQKLGSFTGGPWGGLNFLKSTEAMANRLGVEQAVGKREAESRVAHAYAQGILSRMMSRWGFKHPPSKHLRLLDRVIDSGAFKGMGTPEDFERIQPGTGYLFEIARDITDLMNELGHELRLQGQINDRQFQKFASRYVSHLYIKSEMASSIADLRDGNMPATLAARDLTRKGSGDEDIRIKDPFWWMTTAVAQEGKMRQWHGTLQDLYFGGHMIPRAEFEKLPLHDRQFYLPVTLDRAKNAPGGENGISLRLFDVLSRQLERGTEGPLGERIELSSHMRRVLNDLLGRDAEGKDRNDGGYYLPRQIMQEVDTVTSELFNPPSVDTGLQKIIYGYEVATRQVRRGLTIMRPKHWTLNITNSVMTNHLLGVASMWDFSRSLLTGKGEYADGARDILKYTELTGLKGKLGAKRPADVPPEQWDRLMILQAVLKKLSSGTFVQAGLEGQTVTDIFSSLVEPDDLSRVAVQDILASGKTLNEKNALMGSVFDTVRRMSTGLGAFDRWIGKMTGGNATERARAVAGHVGVYQMFEMWFKHVGTMSTLAKNPGMSLDDAVAFAAGGTADYRNTSPALRGFNTAYGTHNNPLWQRSETGAQRARRAVTRDMLKGRFWMYQTNMILPKLRSTVVHPWRAAAVGTIMAGITQQIMRMGASNPEEDASWEESLSGAMYTAGSRPELMDDSTVEAYRRLGGSGWLPDVIGGARQGHLRAAGGKLLNKMLMGHPFIFPGPKRRGYETVTSLEDLAPGWGDMLGVGRMAGSVMSESKSQKQKAAEFVDWLSFRTMEASMGLFNGAVRMAVPRPGDARGTTVMRNIQDAVGYAMPTVSPMFLASKDGQKMVENLALGGQRLVDWQKGMQSGMAERSPAELVGELVYSTFWRNQIIRQDSPVGPKRDTMALLLKEVIPDIDPGQGEFWDTYKQGQRLVHEQLMNAIGDTYVDFIGGMDSVMTLDAMLARQLFGPENLIDEFISGQDEHLKEPMRRYWDRFVQHPAWADTMHGITLAGRRREMRPGMFKDAVSRALRDPSGGQMLNWIYDKVAEKGALGRDNMMELSSLFQYGVAIPEAGSEKRVQWDTIWRRLGAAGYLPADIPQEGTDAIMRRMGVKPEIQGAPAFVQSMAARPLSAGGVR